MRSESEYQANICMSIQKIKALHFLMHVGTQIKVVSIADESLELTQRLLTLLHLVGRVDILKIRLPQSHWL